MNNAEFIERMSGILSTTNKDDDSKKDALIRLRAIVNFEITKLSTERPKSNYDFSTLPGIDDICVKTIIPYLSNDVQALVNMFGRTTKRFLTVSTVHGAYYCIVLPIKYGGIPGKELIHGCKNGTLTLKDANFLVNTLKRSIKLREDNYLKRNCLHFAGIKGHLSIVQFLVEEFKMDIDVKDGISKRVTYLSAFYGKVDVADYLVTKGGDLRVKNKGLLNGLKNRYNKEFPRGTPLVVACEFGRLEDVKILITAGHVGNGSSSNNMTLKEMVNQVGKSSSYGREYTPLAIAVNNKHQVIIDYLVDIAYADETELFRKYMKQFPRSTPLVCACQKGRLEDVKLLITGHDDVNGSNGNNNNMTLKEYVNQKGIDDSGFRQYTPLGIAINNKHQVIIDYLVDIAYADETELFRKYMKQFPKSTPLVVACQKGLLEDVKLLITGHDDVNGSNGNNNNMTLKEYVNQVGKDSYGREYTPLMAVGKNSSCGTVRYTKDQAIIDYLFSILLDGVTLNTNTLTDIYMKAVPKGTPLVCACEFGRLEHVKILITAGHVGNGSSSNNMTLKDMVNQVGKNRYGTKSRNGIKFTPLMIAVNKKHQVIIDYLVDIAYADETELFRKYMKQFPKSTPLVCACQKGRLEDVKLLITGHDDVNGSNGNNNNMTLKEYVNQEGRTSGGYDRTPVKAAARNGHFEIVHYLIKHGANAADNTPLVCACEKGRLEDVKLLITGHDDVNGSNGNNNNNNMTLKEYVNQTGKDSGGYNNIPLSAAIENNHTDIKMYLIEHGADLHKSYKKEFPRGTPLVCACEKGRLEDVKLLITGHKDVNGSNGNNNMTLKEYVNQVGKDSNGREYTPLAKANYKVIVDYLFSILLDGVTLNTNTLTDVYMKAAPKGTPLVCACEFGRLEHVKILITAGHVGNGSSSNKVTLKEMVNQVGKNSSGGKHTPLMIAAAKERFQIVQYLIEQGEADPNIARSNGDNALHWAAIYNRTNTELIDLLLSHMSLNSINKKASGGGATPLDFAYKSNSPIKQEIITLIRSKGGKANHFDENGRNVGKGNGDLNH